ncbi:unnamed protein product [Colias eurytheme]|nr:unnamed protein product [Colias eurytheme]
MSWILIFLGVVAGLQNEDRAQRVCRAYGYNVVEARFGKEVHLLCLKMQSVGSSALTSDESALLLDPEVNDELTDRLYPLDDVMMAYGFPVEDPAAGSAEGYIGEDQQFYGVLHLGNRTLHADPYGRDDLSKKFGRFENDHVAAPRQPRSDHAQEGTGYARLPYFPYRYQNRARKPGIARSRICDLLLLADKEFYDKDANSSLKHVLRRMIHAVAQADIIFRNADFNEDGIPDNIGFSVKYILVLTSHETNGRVFGDLSNERSVDGRSYLMRFARLRRLSEVCLGVAFSGHAFNNRTLGLSFTSLGGGMGGAAGGLCDRRAFGRSFNTLAVAHATADGLERVPERIAALTLAHEMGHSFGAHHDDNFPNPECRGYLMGSQSSTSETGHKYEFSLCSKRLVAATLNSMSYCMAVVDRPYCGNGIVEEGEACDCGLPFHCNSRDPCCTPRAGGALAFEDGALHKEGCSVAPTATCHPSQGLCCKADCHFANLTKSGIDCTWQDMACTCVNTHGCRCGLGGKCLTDRSCHGAECATLGLRECTCPKTGIGGVLEELKMCGICCLLYDGNTTKCVGAEIAAKYAMAANLLPNDWPDPQYVGPNITLNICNTTTCTSRVIRAWSAGDVCVMNNAVGVCSPRGVCKSVKVLPTSNIYPDVVSINLMSQRSGASKILKSSRRFFITVLLII